jgi:hypothetical protein
MCIGVFVVSFLLTLWLTAPGEMPVQSAPPGLPTPLAIFSSFEISDQVQLAAVAETAGLKPSQTLKGYVDELATSNKGQARIRGWVADIMGQGSPTTILVFAQGKQIFETETKGQRPDVTALFRLSEPAAANVRFDGVFSCRSDKPLLIVAVDAKNSYTQIGRSDAGPLICPPYCPVSLNSESRFDV